MKTKAYGSGDIRKKPKDAPTSVLYEIENDLDYRAQGPEEAAAHELITDELSDRKVSTASAVEALDYQIRTGSRLGAAWASVVSEFGLSGPGCPGEVQKAIAERHPELFRVEAFDESKHKRDDSGKFTSGPGGGGGGGEEGPAPEEPEEQELLTYTDPDTGEEHAIAPEDEAEALGDGYTPGGEEDEHTRNEDIPHFTSLDEINEGTKLSFVPDGEWGEEDVTVVWVEDGVIHAENADQEYFRIDTNDEDFDPENVKVLSSRKKAERQTCQLCGVELSEEEIENGSGQCAVCEMVGGNLDIPEQDEVAFLVGKKASKEVTCPTCKGEGKVVREYAHWPGKKVELTCPECLGRGVILTNEADRKQAWEDEDDNEVQDRVIMDEEADCGICGGPLEVLGVLGHIQHMTCRNCGMMFTRPLQMVAKKTADPYGAPSRYEGDPYWVDGVTGKCRKCERPIESGSAFRYKDGSLYCDQGCGQEAEADFNSMAHDEWMLGGSRRQAIGEPVEPEDQAAENRRQERERQRSNKDVPPQDEWDILDTGEDDYLPPGYAKRNQAMNPGIDSAITYVENELQYLPDDVSPDMVANLLAPLQSRILDEIQNDPAFSDEVYEYIDGLPQIVDKEEAETQIKDLRSKLSARKRGWYDPELPAGFQDADFEMRELEERAREMKPLMDQWEGKRVDTPNGPATVNSVLSEDIVNVKYDQPVNGMPYGDERISDLKLAGRRKADWKGNEDAGDLSHQNAADASEFGPEECPECGSRDITDDNGEEVMECFTCFNEWPREASRRTADHFKPGQEVVTPDGMVATVSRVTRTPEGEIYTVMTMFDEEEDWAPEDLSPVTASRDPEPSGLAPNPIDSVRQAECDDDDTVEASGTMWDEPGGGDYRHHDSVDAISFQ